MTQVPNFSSRPTLLYKVGRSQLEAIGLKVYRTPTSPHSFPHGSKNTIRKYLEREEKLRVLEHSGFQKINSIRFKTYFHTIYKLLMITTFKKKTKIPVSKTFIRVPKGAYYYFTFNSKCVALTPNIKGRAPILPLKNRKP